MSSKLEFTKINPAEVNRRSVSALAIRPNDASRFGQGGLSAKELQAWFDNLAKDAIKVYDEMARILSSKDATKYIGLYSESENGIDNLYDFIKLFGERGGGINDKNISDYIEALYQKATDDESFSYSLAEIVADLQKRIADASAIIEEANATIDDLNEKANSGELDGFSPTVQIADLQKENDEDPGGYEVTITDKESAKKLSLYNGYSPKISIEKTNDGTHAVYIKDAYGTKMFLVRDGASPTVAVEEVDEGHKVTITDENKKHTFLVKDGKNAVSYGIKAEIDNNNYIATIKLIDQATQAVLSDTTIDFPLESVVVGAKYEKENLVITLQNGTSTEIPLGDLIKNLATNTALENVKTEFTSSLKGIQQSISDRYTKSEAADLIDDKIAAAITTVLNTEV